MDANILTNNVIVPMLGIIMALLGVAISAGGAAIIKYFHNAYVEKYVYKAEDAVMTAVGAVNTQLVDDLKKMSEDGVLTDEEKKQAFETAKNIALKQMGIVGKQAVEELYEDFEEWMINKIDFYVGQLK